MGYENCTHTKHLEPHDTYRLSAVLVLKLSDEWKMWSKKGEKKAPTHTDRGNDLNLTTRYGYDF